MTGPARGSSSREPCRRRTAISESVARRPGSEEEEEEEEEEEGEEEEATTRVGRRKTNRSPSSTAAVPVEAWACGKGEDVEAPTAPTAPAAGAVGNGGSWMTDLCLRTAGTADDTMTPSTATSPPSDETVKASLKKS